MTTPDTRATAADARRAEIARLLALPPTRRMLERIDDLIWEQDRLTTGDTINAQRAARGLAPWPNARDREA